MSLLLTLLLCILNGNFSWFQEINRVLRMGGRYICISLLQSHILKKLLDYFPKEGWMFRICRCFDAELSRSQESNVPNFPIFAVVCFKCKKMANAPPVSFTWNII